jgi:PST family polysaccharide transporter
MEKLQAVRGSILTGGVTFLVRPLNIVVTIILARLLTPEDFGLVALAMLLVASSNLFAGLGMGPAVIHTQGDRDKAAFQAFLVTLLSSTLLFLLVFVNAPWLAQFLGDAAVTPILRWLSFMIILMGINVVPNALLAKDLRFERIASATLISEILYLGLALALAFSGLGVWSLIYARIASTLLLVAMTWYFVSGWAWLRPQPWDRTLMSEMLRFGLHNTASGLVSYLHTYWDDWLVGRRFGAASLGFYNKAYELSNRTLTMFSGVIISVFFPYYVKLKGDKAALSRTYLKSFRVLLLIMAPIALGILVTSSELVTVLFGAKWLPMIPLLQIYSIMVLTRPISTNTSPLFMAMGRPDFNTRAGLLLLAIMVSLALLLLPMGTAGVAVAVVVAHIVGMIYNVYQVQTLLPGTARQTALASWPSLLSAVVMAGAVLAVKPLATAWTGGPNTFAGLLILIVVGVVSYGVMLVLTQRTLLREVMELGLSAFGYKRSGIRFVSS